MVREDAKKRSCLFLANPKSGTVACQQDNKMPFSMHSSLTIHPGRWLRSEIVEPHGMSVTETAAKLHVTRQTMSALLNGHAGLSAEMAIRFEKAFGLKADTMLRMQTAYDLAQVRAREREIVVDRMAT